MFRTAAALLAKKTAIVAITGVTVIGGATLALAVEGETVEVAQTEADCSAEQVWDADTETCVPVEAPETCTDDLGETIDCPVEEAPETCTDDLGETIDCPVEEAPETDEVVAEHPDNHGKAVSEAARGVEGSPCAGLSGRAKGQCVANVASGGKAGEAPAEEPAPTEETTSDETVEETDESVTATAEAPKGKPADAGPPAHAGKGKGGKG